MHTPSNYLEKRFPRLANKEARDAYIEAESAHLIASQIRVIRKQRGWTQAELAEKIGTTASVIARYEDPNYGKHSVQKLIKIAQAFDIPFLGKFVTFKKHMAETFDVSPEFLQVIPYSEESDLFKLEKAKEKVFLSSDFFEQKFLDVSIDSINKTYSTPLPSNESLIEEKNWQPENLKNQKKVRPFKRSRERRYTEKAPTYMLTRLLTSDGG